MFASFHCIHSCQTETKSVGNMFHFSVCLSLDTSRLFPFITQKCYFISPSTLTSLLIPLHHSLTHELPVLSVWQCIKLSVSKSNSSWHWWRHTLLMGKGKSTSTWVSCVTAGQSLASCPWTLQARMRISLQKENTIQGPYFLLFTRVTTVIMCWASGVCKMKVTYTQHRKRHLWPQKTESDSVGKELSCLKKKKAA